MMVHLIINRMCMLKKISKYIPFMMVFFCTTQSQHGMAQEKNTSMIHVVGGHKLVDQQLVSTVDHQQLNVDFIHIFSDEPANIVASLSYGLTSKLELGTTYERNGKIYEFGIKYRILAQQVDQSIPLSISYVGSVSKTGAPDNDFGVDYQWIDRLFYHHQLLFGKQFSYKYFVQMATGYTHFNAVDQSFQNDKLSVNMLAGVEVIKKSSVFASYNHPFDCTLIHNNSTATSQSKPTVTFGYEYNSYRHRFHLFVSNSTSYSSGYRTMYNTNDIAIDTMYYGFNIQIKLLGKYSHV